MPFNIFWEDFLRKWKWRGWRDSSAVQSINYSFRGPISIPSTHIAAHIRAEFQFKGIQVSSPGSTSTKHVDGAHTCVQAKHTYTWNKIYKSKTFLNEQGIKMNFQLRFTLLVSLRNSNAKFLWNSSFTTIKHWQTSRYCKYACFEYMYAKRQ